MTEALPHLDQQQPQVATQATGVASTPEGAASDATQFTGRGSLPAVGGSGASPPAPTASELAFGDHAPGSRATQGGAVTGYHAPGKQGSSPLQPALEHLDFHAVAGRPTLPESLQIRNLGPQPLVLDVHLESQRDQAPEFLVTSSTRVLAPPDSSNHPPVSVDVQFLASRPGNHRATLVIVHDGGELRVPLSGSALDIGKHARTEATPGAPEGIHQLPEHPPAIHSPTQARSQLFDAADAVSALALRYQAIEPAWDEAAHGFGERVMAAGSELNTEILEWVRDEGLDQNEQIRENAQESGAGDFFKFLVLKGLGKGLAWAGEKGVELLAEENPISEMIVDAVDIGWSMISTRDGNQEADERAEDYSEHMNDVAEFGIHATDVATRALASRYAGLMSGYVSKRETLRKVAGEASSDLLGKIQLAVRASLGGETNNVATLLDQARAHIDAFRREERSWADALRELADAGARAEDVCDAGYAALLDRYIEFKAGGDRTVRAHGFIESGMDKDNPDLRPNIQLAGFGFGQFSRPSATVEAFINSKTLADLKTWDVEITLTGVPDGSLTLHQGQPGPSDRAAKLEGGLDLRRFGGLDGVWKLLDSATLGATVLGGKQ